MLNPYRKWWVALLCFVGYGAFFTLVAFLPYFSLVALVGGLLVCLLGALASLLPPAWWSHWLARSVPAVIILDGGMRYLQAAGLEVLLWLVLPLASFAVAAALPALATWGADVAQSIWATYSVIVAVCFLIVVDF